MCWRREKLYLGANWNVFISLGEVIFGEHGLPDDRIFASATIGTSGNEEYVGLLFLSCFSSAVSGHCSL